MSYEEEDAQVLTRVARRLSQESRQLFREGHQKGIKSFDAPNVDAHLRGLAEALEQERMALEKQREAIELQRQALTLQAQRWAKFKAALGQ